MHEVLYQSSILLASHIGHKYHSMVIRFDMSEPVFLDHLQRGKNSEGFFIFQEPSVKH